MQVADPLPRCSPLPSQPFGSPPFDFAQGELRGFPTESVSGLKSRNTSANDVILRLRLRMTLGQEASSCPTHIERRDSRLRGAGPPEADKLRGVYPERSRRAQDDIGAGDTWLSPAGRHPGRYAT
jgi:hypothetical protein